MIRILGAAALTTCVACSAPPSVVLDGNVVEAPAIACAPLGDDPTCTVWEGTGTWTTCPDDPEYHWIAVCGDDWFAECSPPGDVGGARVRVQSPCPGCLDGVPTCREGERPHCVPIPRDCPNLVYRGP